jgi:septal ring factor EnvC (AmiA/AmiB activator)
MAVRTGARALVLVAAVRTRAWGLVLVAAVAAALALPHPVAGDQQTELDRTRQRLGQVESVLRDARADAGVVADALAAADQAVGVARGRLALARERLTAARQRRVVALVALEAATDEVAAQEARLAAQVRGAYMTGNVPALAVIVDAGDLRDLLERAVTLSYVIAADQDVLGRLERARTRASELHAAMVRAERERAAAATQVASQLVELERVRAVRQRAKQQLDARVARLAGAAAALRARSAELRRLIRQQELARQRVAAARAARVAAGQPAAAGSGRRCDLSGTSAAERWIILRESGGDPTADNPTSTAFGLGQLLLGNRILYLGRDYATTDCGRQLAAFRAYVRDRYGTAERAKAFWQANGWY